MKIAHLVSIALDQSGVIAHGAQRGLLVDGVTDEGYLVHCVLGQLFGELAPRPFSIRHRRGGVLELLGYCTVTAAELREHGDLFAGPEVHVVCDWTRLASRPVPALSAGRSLGFEARVCPVVRTAEYETDSYLFAREQAAPGAVVNRETVYREWATPQLHGVEVERIDMASYTLTKLLRRGAGDVGRERFVLQRPDVRLTGRMRVTDPVAFRTTLLRGIGRHRGFGFGMILLAP